MDNFFPWYQISSVNKIREEVKTFTYRTPRTKIAKALGELFGTVDTKEEHWLYIAEHWNPRAINRVLDQMWKGLESGNLVIKKSPAAYFTFLVKKRKKRRMGLTEKVEILSYPRQEVKVTRTDFIDEADQVF